MTASSDVPRRRVLPLARDTAIALVLVALAWVAGLFWFVQTLPREDTFADRKTDAIVVLTGGSERLTTGIDLLTRGMGRKLFVSGVGQGVDLTEMLRAIRRPEEALGCCIVLGHAAGDTVGNAWETAAWMQAEGFRSLRLVTAHYHMRRSLLEFRLALPEAEIVPHPIAPGTVHLRDWWRWPGTARLMVSEYNKFLIAFLRYALAAWVGVRAEWLLDTDPLD